VIPIGGTTTCAILTAYARQINDTDMERWVAEIKARAERRAGELLKGMNLPSGARGTATRHEKIAGLP